MARSSNEAVEEQAQIVLEALVEQIPVQRLSGDFWESTYAPLPAEAVQSQLEKILSSRTFHAAEGQRVFLRYTVEQALAGRGHLLKEYVIATEALSRSESFDPRLDPIVRTQARKLRARIAKYYEAEGKSDPVRIDFSKGSYVPSFEKMEPAAPAAVSQPILYVATPPPEVRTPRLSGRWKTAASCVAVLLVAGTGAAAFYRHLAIPFVIPDRPSIAVMPFVNLSDTAEDDVLSDGLSDELIQSFRAVKGLQVIAHASAFHFKAKPINLQEIDRELHVRTTLVGSVRRIHNRLLVTVQLNSVPNGYHLWTGSYDRESTDLQLIESEISKSVSNVLGVAFVDNGNQELTKMLSRPALPNSTAHQSYLQGLEAWHKLTPESLHSAIHFFQQAIADDPSYARAYAALADCYVMTPQIVTSQTSSAETAARIREFAARALALDETLGEAHFDLAISAEYAFDWPTAEAEFKKGLHLSPGNPVGHLWYAKYLALVGRKSEVLAQRTTAAALDPISPYAAQSVAGYLSVMGHYDAAISQFRNALALAPDFGLAHQGLGFTYLLAGRRPEALAELQIAQQLVAGPYRDAALGYAYAVCGEITEAQQILNGFLDQARQAPFPAAAIAQVYIGLGDKDRAFEWLQKAVDQRDLSLDLQWDPVYSSVRPDPRYTVLLHRMKLG